LNYNSLERLKERIMLKLEFELYPQDYGPGPLFDEAVMLGTFEGFQTFIVNGANFSGDMPLLYFARSLKVAMRQLNRNEQADSHQDLDSQGELYFQRYGDLVEVSDNREPPVVGRIALSELTAAAEENAHRVFNACSEVYPNLEREIGGWWTQFDEA
jgi:hypothetical protein